MRSALLTFAVIGPLFLWGLFAPSVAAPVHLVVVGLFEMYLLWDWKGNRPALADPTQDPDGRQILIIRYHQFLTKPVASVGLSRFCSAIALLSIPWALLLLWHREWLLAFLIGATWQFASILASVLNPLDSLEHSAARHPGAAVQLAVLRSLYDEKRLDDETRMT